MIKGRSHQRNGAPLGSTDAYDDDEDNVQGGGGESEVAGVECLQYSSIAVARTILVHKWVLLAAPECTMHDDRL